jgi:polyisoprenoid-binding protein YceI
MTNTTWNLDASHSDVNFRVRHLVISTVSGKFKTFSSVTKTSDDDFSTAEITFEVETASIDTGMEQRDQHLQSDDFFNSEAFPTLIFKSSAVRKLDDEKYEIDGQLTIRDITKPFTLEAEFGGIAKDPYGQIKAGFDVTGKISRKEFGLTWNALTEAGGAVVSDEVKFQANVQYVKAQA